MILGHPAKQECVQFVNFFDKNVLNAVDFPEPLYFWEVKICLLIFQHKIMQK